MTAGFLQPQGASPWYYGQITSAILGSTFGLLFLVRKLLLPSPSRGSVDNLQFLERDVRRHVTNAIDVVPVSTVAVDIISLGVCTTTIVALWLARLRATVDAEAVQRLMSLGVDPHTITPFRGFVVTSDDQR